VEHLPDIDFYSAGNGGGNRDITWPVSERILQVESSFQAA
jgi:hypothetical protein